MALGDLGMVLCIRLYWFLHVGVTMIKSSKIKYPETPFNFSGCPRHICR